MNSHRRRCARRVLLAAALLVSSLASGIAGAAQFSLNQTRVHLNRGHAVETLVLSNADAEPVSFEVEVKRWRQEADGRWQLAASDELVVHPLILTVPGNGQARLRVGTLSPSVSAEQAFRVELQQLPDAKRSGAVQIKMLTRLSIPVFIQPQPAAPKAALAVTRLSDASAELTVSNPGSGYLPPQAAKLRVLDAQGRTLYEGNLPLGYTLAGATLHVTTKLPAGVCAHANRVELALEEPLPPLDASIANSVRQCGR